MCLTLVMMFNVTTVRMESSAMDMLVLREKDLLWKIFMKLELMVLREK